MVIYNTITRHNIQYTVRLQNEIYHRYDIANNIRYDCKTKYTYDARLQIIIYDTVRLQIIKDD